MAKHVLGMGNPLLDMSSPVSQELLDKYDLKMNNAILAEDNHMPLYDEMAKLPGVEFIAGGATQNSIRVCQMMLNLAKQEGATSYMGCIGNDENGEKMKACCKNDGVATYYAVDAATPTGVCAVGVLDKERTLCTKLEAANNYKLEHFQEAAQQAVLTKAEIIYSSGFFFTVCPDAMLEAAKHCTANKKTYTLNLAAPFIMQVPPFLAAMKNTLPYTDIVFGNESEAVVFAEAHEWSEREIPDIAKKIQALPKEGDVPRMVVITQGSQPTVVADANGVTEYKVDLIEESKIVDSNGAGDAFVGGFLAGLAQGCPIEECCTAGNHAAGEIIQQSGCQWSPSFSYTFKSVAA